MTVAVAATTAATTVATTSTPQALHAANITVVRGGRETLRDVSLSARVGEVTVLIGENGAGKSTLLDVLAGDLRAPDGLRSGSVLLGNEALHTAGVRQRARARAVLPQQGQVVFGARAVDVVLLGRSPWSVAPAADDMDIALDALNAVDAADLAARDVLTLSGGELQRVHLARVLAWLRGDLRSGERPRCLLLDEPGTYLDFHAQDLLARTARRVAADGVAVVAVVHDLNFAAAVAEQVVVLQQGRVVAAGSVLDVLRPEVLRSALSAPVQLAGVVDGRPVLVLERPGAP